MSGKRARRIRRGMPIHAYVGPNGGGKSLAMVYDTLPTLASGRRVVSTVKLLGADGEAHPLWVPLDDFRVLLEAEHCDVLLDEVTNVASSRESMGLPPEVATMLVQLRRRDVTLRWTAPNWARADKIIRECSQAVTLCMGFIPESVQEGERLWRPRRLFFWRTYDAVAFDEFTMYRKDKTRPMTRQLFWRPGSEAQGAYDTLDAVLALGSAAGDGSGTCLHCGGKRRARPCDCEAHNRKISRPRLELEQTNR